MKTIGPVQDAHNNLARMKRIKGEDDYSFARRKYDMQMEIYSAWSMTDLWVPFETLPEKVRRQWVDGVKST